MAPSRLHGELASALDHIVDVAASALTGAVKGLLSARLREPGSPPGTGMEPDCAFYFGEKARAYRTALADGKEAADAFFDDNAPDLVVEVEITNADESKIERYVDLGVRELWLLHDPDGSGAPQAEFLALRPRTAPHRLASSTVLRGLTPDDICEAIVGVRLSVTRDERTEAVARIVRRRQRVSVRVREGETPYARSG